MRNESEYLSAEEYRAILRTSLDGFLLLDGEGRLLEVNEAYCRMTGFSRDELLGKRVEGLTLEETPEQTREHLARILRERTGRFESRHRKKDGGWVILDVSVSGLEDPKPRVVVFLRDIDERKRVEQALRESEEKFSRIFHASTNLVAFTEPETGRIVEVNDTWVVATGISREQAVGKSALELGLWIEPSVRQRALAQLHQHGRLRDLEMSVQSTSGELQLMASAEYVDVRGSRYLLWELRDVSAQKQAEREQEKLRAQLLQAQKLESVGRLAGGVAHDFNNLLTVINGYSTLLLAQLSPNDPVRRQVEEIRQAGDRASGLTQQLLAMSRTQAGEPAPMNLNNSVKETVRLLSCVIGEDIHVSLALDPDLGLVNADVVQMHQVLMNLALNARDAMPQGGQLTLETSHVAATDIMIPAGVAGGATELVRLCVRDTGIGMSEQTARQIFEPFFTTKPQGAGTGLGLSTTYGIVQQAGGWIAVQSAPGDGTAFEVYLPRVAGSGVDDVAFEHPTRERGGVETILVVEDQPGVRHFAAEVLRDHGYRVLEAGGAAEALEISAGLGRSLNLLLTDIIMPDVNGLALAERIQPGHTRAQILFMTAYAGDVLQQRGLLRDDIHCLQKPFRPEELARKVREMLDRPGSSQGPTVLVVDDEAGVRRMLHDTLADAGYSVIEAENGLAALGILAKVTVAVMLTDLVMPEKEGLETIGEARKRYPDMKIISMSGAFGGHYMKVASFLGADARLAKPIDVDELLNTLQQLLAR